ncbi:ABC transporter related [Methanoregula boonei 6A8]|uniref:ABC transporter related n=1 Tax=Methanoregula boonei (strain DSM 21154 / JCM 14090 / 6A8) TaxID=456442 RepID=A7I985_METB6|nr:ABC transporter related [Methanoregula boonei 6A8]
MTKIYAGSPVPALNSVSFTLPARGVFVLIGRNGSGKTTLVRILATNLEATSGTATLNGIDVMSEPDQIRERIAIVPQEARPVPWMTPLQSVLSYLLWRGLGYGEAKQKAGEVLEKLKFGRKARVLNRTLSGGMKRKVLMAMILATEADVIFLDEPTTGLDPLARREFWEVLQEVRKDRFVVLTTHYMEEAEQLADTIGVLEEGKLIALGTLDELRKRLRYNYSVKLLSIPEAPVILTEGEMVKGNHDLPVILTTEGEAFRIAQELSREGIKFTINPVGLEDIFFYLHPGGDTGGR